MIVREYIRKRFQSFGISVSEADLFDMSLSVGSLTDEITSENVDKLNKALVEFIPSLLLRPVSISEGGMSVSYDLKALKEYYSLQCKKYGIENALSSSISDASNVW